MVKLKSPFHGLPDGEVLFPKKPVRITFTPQETMFLHVLLDVALRHAETCEKPHPPGYVELLDALYEKVLDRLEVSFK